MVASTLMRASAATTARTRTETSVWTGFRHNFPSKLRDFEYFPIPCCPAYPSSTICEGSIWKGFHIYVRHVSSDCDFFLQALRPSMRGYPFTTKRPCHDETAPATKSRSQLRWLDLQKKKKYEKKKNEKQFLSRSAYDHDLPCFASSALDFFYAGASLRGHDLVDRRAALQRQRCSFSPFFFPLIILRLDSTASSVS